LANKNSRLPRATAVALSAAVLGSLAFLPGVSASTADGAFGIGSVNSEDSSIRGYAGMTRAASSPGNPSTPSTPGTGDPSTPSSPETPAPPTCDLDLVAPTGFTDPFFGANLLVPTAAVSPSNPHGFSHWIEEVEAAGGKVKAGKPVASVPAVSFYNEATGEQGYVEKVIEMPELTLSDIKVVPANSTEQMDYWSDAQKESAKYSALEMAGGFPDPGAIDDIANTAAFKELAGIDSKSSRIYVSTSEINITYPVTIEWPEGSKHSNCATPQISANFYSYYGAL